jgi:hypothetical protein
MELVNNVLIGPPVDNVFWSCMFICPAAQSLDKTERCVVSLLIAVSTSSCTDLI